MRVSINSRLWVSLVHKIQPTFSKKYIACKEGQAGQFCLHNTMYVGETSQCFETRKKEHIRNVKTCANGSNIAKHAWSFNYRIDFDNSSVIDKGSCRIRKTLEVWHTSATKHADNNSKPIPNQYSIIFES